MSSVIFEVFFQSGFLVGSVFMLVYMIRDDRPVRIGFVMWYMLMFVLSAVIIGTILFDPMRELGPSFYGHLRNQGGLLIFGHAMLFFWYFYGSNKVER